VTGKDRFFDGVRFLLDLRFSSGRLSFVLSSSAENDTCFGAGGELGAILIPVPTLFSPQSPLPELQSYSPVVDFDSLFWSL